MVRRGKTAEDKSGENTYETLGKCEEQTGKVTLSTPSCAIIRQLQLVVYPDN